ncbi:MAG: hypothetical protein ABIR70_24515 [Bryobacteraceae bacterium]
MTSKISATALAGIASQTGPCLTVLVPGHHAGTTGNSQRAQFRTLLKEVRESVTPWPTAFDVPLGELAQTFPETGPGVAVYCTAGSVTSVSLTGDTPKSVLASHPYLMPLLVPAYAAHHLFVLGLSTQHLRLLEYVDGVCKIVDLPTGIPANLASSRHSHRGESPSETASSAGPGVGKMGAMRFGTSGDRETARDAMDHFCALIDQGLRPLLQGQPLLLMGVKEEIAAYRRVSHYESLMHAEVDGNIDSFTPAHIAGLAHTAALTEYERLGNAVLAEFREMRDRARTALGPREVLQAAAEGRVHQLCVRGGTEMFSPLEPALDLAGLPHEDLINAAVVETLRHHGEIYLLPASEMAVTDSVCAILRY